MKQLSHNGILVNKYQPKKFGIILRGSRIQLTAEQEEMAVAWVKKLGTDYVKDEVFARNFFEDFGKALGKGKISPEDVDFTEIIKAVEKERNEKLNMPKEERKRQAEERKKMREENKERYGYVVVDGERVEVSNYIAEPSSIFMGRGKHPLRGRWKKGAKEEDIILNLSPDSPIPQSFLIVANHCQLERFINEYFHCKFGDEIFCRLTKIHGQKNITSENIEKLKKIQNFMQSFLRNIESGQKLIEILQEKLGENGLKNSKKIQKNMQNITGGKLSRLDFIESSSLECVLIILEKLTFSKNTEGNVNSVETAISGFLSSIIEPRLIENFQKQGKALTIGEILKKGEICKYCVVIAIGLFTCLNISVNMPWKKVVWSQNLWTAKWDDKLRGKEKYVWLSDTSAVKQAREKEKFDKAIELGKEYEKIKKHITDNLAAEDLKRRKIATVCYLIDALSMRVGDEKDEDEADTVGATTLTKDNVIIKQNNLVRFDFLGKDSVRWEKEIVLPEQVVKNLKEFMAGSQSEIFEGVRSENVKLFLNEVVPGLTSKVFRTFHASKAVEDYFKKTDVKREDVEDYKKYFATMANLQAAVVCNHKRTLPKSWENTLQNKMERLKVMKERLEEKRNKAIDVLEQRIKKLESMQPTEKRGMKLEGYKKKLNSLKVGISEKDEEKIKKMELKIKLMKETRDYNLNTSLKSYIDPRIYWKWSNKVNFNWKKYYSKTLQRKFSWVEKKLHSSS